MPRTRKPAVGSVVLYHEPDSGTVRKAVVIHLYDDPDDPRGRVELAIGHPHGCDIRPVVPFGAGKFGHWSWPAKAAPACDGGPALPADG